MKLSRGYKIVGTLLLLVFVLGGFFVAQRHAYLSDCKARKTSYPTYPLFPQSELIEQNSVADWDWEAAISYNYVADATFEAVRAHFQSKSNCGISTSQYWSRCTGRAVPFGTYEILIEFDPETKNTSYAVNVRWARCYPGYEGPPRE